MKLGPYLEKAAIDISLHAPAASSMLRTLVEKLNCSGADLDVDCAIEELLKRESSCSTGVGNGLAIPHATIEKLSTTQLAIATLADPIDFNAMDGRPVRLVFLLLSPPGYTKEHVALLARIARMCSNEIFMEMMMQAESVEELRQLMIDEDERHVG